MKTKFTGFSQEGLNFLQTVRLKNDKEWFEEHRPVYEKRVLEPFKLLVEELTPCMLKIDQWFETKPAVNKTISRIHRDTRFSNDKTRYRDRFWLTFKRPSKDWKESPAYFFEIGPDAYRYGLGYYCTSKETMDIFRKEINRDPEAFLNVAKSCKKPFELVGESYKRPLIKEQPTEIATWYNRKSFAVMVTSHQVEETFSPDLVKRLTKGFQQLVPLYDYLMRVEIIKNIPE
ncbi:DUF2461 domain-containing protein [Zophobihabitans entericus]|uniref:DUF2461 domain-containing protein n=1 Tax=Zophobihabitans entericus TaxID=1635327 RepID=A0A6G9IDB1_9GAMM|nr:DUF2461 domain-containing protein [Zophobihabitans entericus]QIQ21827.1 DUF2461 domain-containing protein [Zophobihabitans entericus]